MSKERGFVEGPAESSFVPSAPSAPPTAPPTYDEAMAQASAAYMPMPGSHSMLHHMPQGMSMPQAMPIPHQMPMPQPMPSYIPASQGPSLQPAPISYPVQAPTQVPSTIIITNVPLGRDRCHMMCPKCNARVLTETVEENHCMAHVWCCLLMCLGCPCCSCLPYCMDSCKTVKHKCPNCKKHLGTYKPY